MRKRRNLWELAGFLFVLAAGTALHFTYDWSGGAPLVGAFSAVNESTWEHMKLLFFPLFVFSAVQLCCHHEPNLLAVRAVSALVGTALIPALFYTYTGILGRDVPWADAAIFLVAAGVTFALDARLLRRGALDAPWMQAVGLLVLWGMAFLLIYWTFRPPHIPLFRDPVTGTFGIPTVL